MQNHFRESIDQGLVELKKKQGTGGLPAAPPSTQAAGKEAPYAEVAPPPAPTDSADIKAETAEADKSETEAAAAAQNNPAQLAPNPGVRNSARPVPIQAPGQSIAEAGPYGGKLLSLPERNRAPQAHLRKIRPPSAA